MLDRAWIAQSVEQRIENPRVGVRFPLQAPKNARRLRRRFFYFTPLRKDSFAYFALVSSEVRVYSGGN